MRAAASDPAPCRTVRGLAASRRPFGDARSLVRHGAGVEPPPRHQAIQSKKEVLTFNRDLTGGGAGKRMDRSEIVSISWGERGHRNPHPLPPRLMAAHCGKPFAGASSKNRIRFNLRTR